MIRLPKYIHEQSDWPHFSYGLPLLSTKLATVSRHQGILLGSVQSLGFDLKQEATLSTLTEDVVQTSAIEGEHLDEKQVRSSVARHLGIDIGLRPLPDRRVDGIVDMMLDATQNYAEPLTAERLFRWHAGLFPTGFGPLGKIVVGGWRQGDMNVVSGLLGREHIHFEAPAAYRLDEEMARFLVWFNDETESGEILVPGRDPVLKSALAHLWFVTIHPFDDGNGRIARAIGDMLLARSDGSTYRFYSMSSQIREERRQYYQVLEETQKGALDVTAWIFWYLNCLDRALSRSEDILSAVLFKADFWQRTAVRTVNDRQRKVLNRLLDGFEGNLTAEKWARIVGCSKPTAVRDINDLIVQGILVKNEAGGRSTSYRINGKRVES
jgi:Fic family protein